MLTVLLGTDWTANREYILNKIADDVQHKAGHRILLVPELISHDTERRLCSVAGDTCSRFAEVLSFTRLTRRVCDWNQCGLEDCLDEGGRIVAMASAVRQLHSKLKAYAALETRPEFLTGLVDAVDEFKRCCITSQDLSAASGKASGAFAQKLEELSLLLESYDAVCARGKRDPRDQLTWGLEQLQNSDFAQKHTVYIDGFPDFTRQNMAIISHFIRYSPNVTISLNCDCPGSSNLAFQKAGETASRILKTAQTLGITTEIHVVPPKDRPLISLCQNLFQGKTTVIPKISDKVRIAQADSVYEECLKAAEEILELVRNGARFKDISVVCTDTATYANALQMQLQLCNIPMYLAGTEEILEKSVITTVLTALDAALGHFDTKDILRYAKSSLSPLSLQTCDILENYALLWSIQGKKWLSDWQQHPSGLVDTWSDADKQLIVDINQARKLVIDPLNRLAQGFQKATSLSHQVNALYAYLEEILLADRLQILAEELDAAGDNRNAQILNQLWDILLSALQQLNDMLGDTAWDSDSFVRLLRLLLSQYDVGTIPPVLDTVMVGPIAAMRCQEVKHLIILGAEEGAFPAYGSTSGVLSDQERNALRQMGVPLTGGASEGLQISFSEIYGVFCGAAESIYVSAPSTQPSFVYKRLLDMVGTQFTRSMPLGAAGVNTREAASYLCSYNCAAAADKLGISDEYNQVEHKKNHVLGNVTKDGVTGLYGNKLNLSASQIDKQADCRLAYFLKYGLRAKEQIPVTVDPAEFGTYVHAVLEQTGREIRELGGFKATALDDALRIAQKYADQYTQEHFSQLDSQRIHYLFQRNNQELMMVVEELWKELQNSSFEPLDFEVSFGDGAQLPAIQISGHTMEAQLRGFVDRVDVWQEAGRNYFRVVDYKTGKKDFDYCDVLNGLGLQMLLYLFALEKEGQHLLGQHPIPAGVQYFPARVPVISADADLSEDEVEELRTANWKHKGLILGDQDVLFAMENEEVPVRLSCKIKKDGTVTGDIANRQQFQDLDTFIFRLLGNMVDEIASGNVTPNPYSRGSSHDACRYCPYGAVCHSAFVDGRRNYKTVSSQRFWEEIGKEMDKHG